MLLQQQVTILVRYSYLGTLISLIAKKDGISQEGRKLQEKKRYIDRKIVNQGVCIKVQKTISETPLLIIWIISLKEFI